MEYLVGSLATIIAFVIYHRLTRESFEEISKVGQRITYSQSYMFNLLHPLIPSNDYLKKLNPKKTQSYLHHEKLYIKIMFYEDKAYWIKDNKFFTADMVDGKIVEDSEKTVDTMAMDKVELDKMAFIVDMLTKGKTDDRGITGNS
jgi:hypothetical protein